MANIYATNINELVKENQINYFLSIISEEKKRRIERFHFRADYIRSLYGDVIVRKVIEEKMKINCKDIQFDVNEYGKPYVLGVPDFQFNISHSGDWVVCITSLNECGIDIEKKTEVHMDIAERFFAESEYMALLNKKDEEQRDYFFDLWTLKESYIKYKGKGLKIPLNSFSFDKRNESFYLNPHIEEKVLFKQYNIQSGYSLSACVEERIQGLQYINMMLF